MLHALQSLRPDGGSAMHVMENVDGLLLAARMRGSFLSGLPLYKSYGVTSDVGPGSAWAQALAAYDQA